ncbi:MAG: cytochrome c3 family protein [Candidatus Acidiferrales bacterium]
MAAVTSLAVAVFFCPAVPARQIRQQAAPPATAVQSPPKSSAQVAGPEQPIPFSHKTHTSISLGCKFCHTNPDPGNDMTFPDTQRCMACHQTIDRNQPPIQSLAKFAESKKPVPWVRVYAVPAWVFWSHRTHLDAGVKCEMCHGNVGQMDVVARVTKVTTMDGCVSCHQEKEATTGCRSCHEDKSSQERISPRELAVLRRANSDERYLRAPSSSSAARSR